jgi:acetyl-CoA synthetase
MEMVKKSDVYWRPSARTIAESRIQAFITAVGASDYEDLNARSEADPSWYWDALIKYLDIRFFAPYTQVMDTAKGIPWTRWCIGGTTNIVLNCLDRHRNTPRWNRTYMVGITEDDKQKSFTYAEFDAEVCRLANAFRAEGLGKGDVISLYMPGLPEAYIALFAIIKIGAIALPLFSGYGPEPIVVRLVEGEAKAVVTADGTWRRGREIAMKQSLDEALQSCPTVRRVFVVRNLGDKVPCPMKKGRDLWWHEAVAKQSAEAATEPMGSDDVALLVFTSGTTGKPKGTKLSHAGFTVRLAMDYGLIFDMRETDRMMWISDMGWLVGPMTAVGTTVNGASLVVAEGTPDYPDTGRHWRLMQEQRITYQGIAPTTVRSLMRYGDEVDRYDFSALRIIMGSGEPWTHDAWVWLFERVGKMRVPILNYTGGTEVGGGIVGSTVIHPMKPCSFSGPMPGTGARIFDDAGKPVGPGQLGELVMTLPSIGLTRSLWKDDDRYIETYWSMYDNVWRHGDWAIMDDDGLWYLLGRSDDTLKISGKRTGPAEIEGVLMATGKIVEAAVIGLPDDIKGNAVGCVCVPMPGVAASEALRAELSQAVVAKMGTSYRPKQVIFVSDLPKTRNLKIMRRMVRSVILGEPAGDTSSLVNPEAIDELRARIAS